MRSIIITAVLTAPALFAQGACGGGPTGQLSYSWGRSWTEASFSYRPLWELRDVHIQATKVRADGMRESFREKTKKKMKAGLSYFLHGFRYKEDALRYEVKIYTPGGRTECFSMKLRQRPVELIRRY